MKNQIVPAPKTEVVEAQGEEIAAPSDDDDDFINKMSRIAEQSQSKFLYPNMRMARRVEGEIAHTFTTLFEGLAEIGSRLEDD